MVSGTTRSRTSCSTNGSRVEVKMSTAMILRKSSWVVILGPAKSDTVTREDDEIEGTVRRRRNRERERRCVREKGSHGTIRGIFCSRAAATSTYQRAMKKGTAIYACVEDRFEGDGPRHDVRWSLCI